MGASGWNIKFFRLSSGRCPFDEFFDDLRKEDQVRIRSRLEKVRLEGPRYDQFSSLLRDEIYELRFNISAGTTRLFFLLPAQPDDRHHSRNTEETTEDQGV